MKKIKILSKMMALIYIANEFGNGNLKVTTILDEDGMWQGKVILESTNESPKDDEDMAEFYIKAICSEKLKKGD